MQRVKKQTKIIMEKKHEQQNIYSWLGMMKMDNRIKDLPFGRAQDKAKRKTKVTMKSISA